ncbi:MAG TPA: DMT family transporter [Longimicrobiaceae bacterium]|nr:DMT family transporter [Longimicrobiaceae bacterium]
METTTIEQRTPITLSPERRLTGYLLALTAGTIWGTTGVFSNALHEAGVEVTDVGFWRILLASLGFIVYGVARPEIFRFDRRALWLVAGVGGALVGGFEIAYQFAIDGVGIASAVALLYTAPVIVALLAWLLLGERLTPLRMLLAVAVMAGAAMTVLGAWQEEVGVTTLGITGGIIAALCWSGSILVARFAVPIYGAVRVLFLTLAGGTLILALVLPLAGHTPAPPGTGVAWLLVLGLGVGTVLANFAFLGGVKRIDAAPASVAATVEPVVAALLGLLLFGHTLMAVGWVGLALVVGGVAGGYLREAEEAPAAA